MYSGKEEDSPELRELTRARQRKGMRGRATFRFYQLVQVCRSVEKTYWFSLLVFACILLASVMTTIEIEPTLDPIRTAGWYKDSFETVLEVTC